MTDEAIGVRVQRMPSAEQVIVPASIVARHSDDDTFTGRAVMDLFNGTALPPPAKIGNFFGTLKNNG